MGVLSSPSNQTNWLTLYFGRVVMPLQRREVHPKCWEVLEKSWLRMQPYQQQKQNITQVCTTELTESLEFGSASWRKWKGPGRFSKLIKPWIEEEHVYAWAASAMSQAEEILGQLGSRTRGVQVCFCKELGWIRPTRGCKVGQQTSSAASSFYLSTTLLIEHHWDFCCSAVLVFNLVGFWPCPGHD